ncbi:MAG: DUF167 family protein [Paracoccaceae bacterium]
MADRGPWRAVASGLEVVVRVTPRGGRDGIDGVELRDGRPVLKVRVACPPVDGAANVALEALLARTVGVARRAVRVVSGPTARIKTVSIDGEPGDIEARLRACV